VDGAKLREARLVAGLSAREVAEAIGVTSRSIERAEARPVRPATYYRHVAAVRQVLLERLDAFDRFLAGG
jgi:transcriptional regulator with XRE-family HTH domain